MKIAIIGDTHFRFGLGSPIGRSDTFEEDILAKLQHLINILHSRQISYLIIPGDVFDVKSTSKYHFDSIVQLQKILSLFKDASIELLVIAGNHDLPYSSLSHLEHSVFQYFVNLELITHIASPQKLSSYTICGVDYLHDKELLLEKIRKIDSDIAVIHYDVLPRMAMSRYSDTPLYYSELIECNRRVKIWVLGHLHIDIPPMRLNDRLFINTGSFSRMSRTYYNLHEHKVFVDIVDVSDLSFERVNLPMKDYVQAFIPKEVDKTFEIESKINHLISEVPISDDSEFDHLSSKIKDLVYEYIEKARSEICH